MFSVHIERGNKKTKRDASSKTYIQGVPGGKDLTSGECSLGQTIPI